MSRDAVRRMNRMLEQVQAIPVSVTPVVTFDLGDPRAPVPEWAVPTSPGHGAVILTEDLERHARILKALVAGEEQPKGAVVNHLKRGLSQFVIASVSSRALEVSPFQVACWSSRGERKTSGALVAIMLLAWLHKEHGGVLPYRVICAASSFSLHEKKTLRTVQAAHWGGVWTIRKAGSEVALIVNGEELACLDVFGTGDASGADRLRMESHALFIDEIAPAAADGDGGVSQEDFAVGVSSLRLPSRRRCVMIASNYPDEDHWAWRLFEMDPQPGTASIRIPPGESASAEERQQMYDALASRPDLLRRLYFGEPGSVSQGPQVALGFNSDTHVMKQSVPIERGEMVWGWDSAANAHTHSLVVLQRVVKDSRDRIILHAGLFIEDAPLQFFVDRIVIPWVESYCPWVLGRGGGEEIRHVYDPNLRTDGGADWSANPFLLLKKTFGGTWKEGPTEWMARMGPLLSVLNEGDRRGGQRFQVDPAPENRTMIQALVSRWYYKVDKSGRVMKELPFKPNHPFEDLGDALLYALHGIAPGRPERPGVRPDGRPWKVNRATEWNPLNNDHVRSTGERRNDFQRGWPWYRA